MEHLHDVVSAILKERNADNTLHRMTRSTLKRLPLYFGGSIFHSAFSGRDGHWKEFIVT